MSSATGMSPPPAAPSATAFRTAAAESGQVERDVAVAGRLNAGDNRLVIGDNRREFRRRQLNAGDLAVMPHAKLPDSPRHQDILGRLDLAQQLRVDRCAVRHA